MSKSKGFCPKVEQAKIRRHRQKFFQLVLQQTGCVETARQVLKNRPYCKYIPNVGIVFMSKEDLALDINQLQDIGINLTEQD
jgi:hypothetical protein